VRGLGKKRKNIEKDGFDDQGNTGYCNMSWKEHPADCYNTIKRTSVEHTIARCFRSALILFVVGVPGKDGVL
jgi:hypothetical protein